MTLSDFLQMLKLMSELWGSDELVNVTVTETEEGNIIKIDRMSGVGRGASGAIKDFDIEQGRYSISEIIRYVEAMLD